MPRLDHFRPPVTDDIDRNTFHAVWAGCIADYLIARVPRDEFQVREHLKLGGGCEIDIAALQHPVAANGGTPARVSDWQPPPAVSVPATFPDQFEVLVYRQFGGRRLVAAVELVSPGNKDDATARAAFTAKVVSYLHEGVNVLVVNVVTDRHANLHDEIVALMPMPDDLQLPPGPSLYAVSYRPVLRAGRPEIDVWANQFWVGDALPVMPLRLIAEYFVPLELETTYTAARKRRLID